MHRPRLPTSTTIHGNLIQLIQVWPCEPCGSASRRQFQFQFQFQHPVPSASELRAIDPRTLVSTLRFATPVTLKLLSSVRRTLHPSPPPTSPFTFRPLLTCNAHCRSGPTRAGGTHSLLGGLYQVNLWPLTYLLSLRTLLHACTPVLLARGSCGHRTFGLLNARVPSLAGSLAGLWRTSLSKRPRSTANGKAGNGKRHCCEAWLTCRPDCWLGVVFCGCLCAWRPFCVETYCSSTSTPASVTAAGAMGVALCHGRS